MSHSVTTNPLPNPLVTNSNADQAVLASSTGATPANTATASTLERHRDSQGNNANASTGSQRNCFVRMIYAMVSWVLFVMTLGLCDLFQKQRSQPIQEQNAAGDASTASPSANMPVPPTTIGPNATADASASAAPADQQSTDSVGDATPAVVTGNGGDTAPESTTHTTEPSAAPTTGADASSGNAGATGNSVVPDSSAQPSAAPTTGADASSANAGTSGNSVVPDSSAQPSTAPTTGADASSVNAGASGNSVVPNSSAQPSAAPTTDADASSANAGTSGNSVVPDSSVQPSTAPALPTLPGSNSAVVTPTGDEGVPDLDVIDDTTGSTGITGSDLSKEAILLALIDYLNDCKVDYLLEQGIFKNSGDGDPSKVLESLKKEGKVTNGMPVPHVAQLLLNELKCLSPRLCEGEDIQKALTAIGQKVRQEKQSRPTAEVEISINELQNVVQGLHESNRNVFLELAYFLRHLTKEIAIKPRTAIFNAIFPMILPTGLEKDTLLTLQVGLWHFIKNSDKIAKPEVHIVQADKKGVQLTTCGDKAIEALVEFLSGCDFKRLEALSAFVATHGATKAFSTEFANKFSSDPEYKPAKDEDPIKMAHTLAMIIYTRHPGLLTHISNESEPGEPPVITLYDNLVELARNNQCDPENLKKAIDAMGMPEKYLLNKTIGLLAAIKQKTEKGYADKAIDAVLPAFVGNKKHVRVIKPTSDNPTPVKPDLVHLENQGHVFNALRALIDYHSKVFIDVADSTDSTVEVEVVGGSTELVPLSASDTAIAGSAPVAHLLSAV